MVDVVDRATRSRMMSGIRGRDTKPEMEIRSALHRQGFRFRLHVSSLPGRPDLVFPKYNAVIFVHGCFWHGHQCRYFRLPETRRTFWKNKIEMNRLRDARVRAETISINWRCLIIWECSLRGRSGAERRKVYSKTAKWLLSRRRGGTIK
jgi:DNA mismatch endonuclease (patch repair protein)